MGKRGNGEGSISRRKKGGWMAQYVLYTAKGRKRKPRGSGEACYGSFQS
jgi:integrase